MSNERSDLLYHAWRDSSEKFDYFVAGVTGALTAYIGQNLHLARLGWNATTLELMALVTLVASVVYGFKRIEATVEFFKLNSQALRADEIGGSALTVARQGGMGINTESGEVFTNAQLLQRVRDYQAISEKADAALRDASERNAHLYRWRNRLLFIGFGALVAARVLAAY